MGSDRIPYIMLFFPQWLIKVNAIKELVFIHLKTVRLKLNELSAQAVTRL